MRQARLDVDDLPERTDAAAAAFYERWLPRAETMIAGDIDALVLVLPAAGPEHDDWRRAAVRDLARAHAPTRVNMLAGGDGKARESSLAYLAGASGVTGQYLPLA